MKCRYKLFIFLFFLIPNLLTGQAVTKETFLMHTDKNVYVTGEEVRYKLYLQDNDSKNSNLSSVGYLVMRGVNKAPFFKQRVELSSGIANGLIQLPDSLPSGIYQILSYTNTMRNDGENSFSAKQIIIINKYDNDFAFKIPEIKTIQSNPDNYQTVRYSINKTVFHSREKVLLRLENIDSRANLSVSVSEKNKFNFEDGNILNKSAGQLSHPTEKNGKILNGMVYDSNSNAPVANAMVVLSCNDTVSNLAYSKTDADGRFEIPVTSYFQDKKLYLTIQNVPDDKQWKLKIDDPLKLENDWHPVTKLAVNNEMKEYLINCQKLADINLAYYPNENAVPFLKTENSGICPKFYQCKPVVVKPSDYTALNGFKEICVEILPQVKFFKENGKSKISIQGNNALNVTNSNPVVFLDGVYLDDLDKLTSLNSDKIKKIEIVYNERAFGDFIYNGALSVFTKSTEIENMKPASHSLFYDDREEKSRFQHTNEIYNPAPKESKMPFFKQLLYWNPQITMNNNTCEFYTPDNTGIFVISIRGISGNGEKINQDIEIQVIN